MVIMGIMDGVVDMMCIGIVFDDFFDGNFDAFLSFFCFFLHLFTSFFTTFLPLFFHFSPLFLPFFTPFLTFSLLVWRRHSEIRAHVALYQVHWPNTHPRRPTQINVSSPSTRSRARIWTQPARDRNTWPIKVLVSVTWLWHCKFVYFAAV